MLQNATPLRKSPPWPPNISDEHVSCTALAMRNASFQCTAPAIVFENATKPSRFAHFWQGAQSPAPATENDIWTSKSAPYPSRFFHFWLGNVLRATTACTFSTSQLPKVVRAWRALYILTSKRASRHNGVHFFDISTSKSGPNMVCFVHFDFEMCFAPQRRALFRHSFQKCSDILTWKCASRHSGAHFFDISASKSAPRLRCFVHFDLEMCFAPQRRATFHLLIWPDGSAPAALASLLFDPPEPQIIGKTQCFATFLPFRAPGSFFFWDFLFFDLLFFSSLTLPISAFHLPILSEVWLLNILRPGSTTTIATWVVVCLNFDMIEYGLV